MVFSAQKSSARLRTVAATIVTLSGFGYVAILWLRPLDTNTVLIAGCGAMYLLLGLGLFGLSRTSLILGIVLPTARSLLVLWLIGTSTLHLPSHLFLIADALAICLCTVILQRVRHLPSV